MSTNSTSSGVDLPSNTNEQWALQSTWFIAPVLLIIAYKGRFRHYVAEVAFLVLLMYASFANHGCATYQLKWCQGRSPDELVLQDVTFAFLAMIAVVAPAVDQWLPRSYGRYLYFAYWLVMAPLTMYLVDSYETGITASITLPAINVVLFGWCLMHRIYAMFGRTPPGSKSVSRSLVKPVKDCAFWLWWAELGTGIALLVAYAVVYAVSQSDYHTNTTGIQSNAYLMTHGFSHACLLGGAFIALTYDQVEECDGGGNSPPIASLQQQGKSTRGDYLAVGIEQPSKPEDAILLARWRAIFFQGTGLASTVASVGTPPETIKVRLESLLGKLKTGLIAGAARDNQNAELQLVQVKKEFPKFLA